MDKTSATDSFDDTDCYDTPPKAVPVISSPTRSPSPISQSGYALPRPTTSKSCVMPLDSYDVPRPATQPLTPSSSTSSLTNDGSSLSGSNRYAYSYKTNNIQYCRLNMNQLMSAERTQV